MDGGVDDAGAMLGDDGKLSPRDITPISSIRWLTAGNIINMDRHAPGSLNLSVPHVTIPLEQAWDLVPVHHIQNFQIILWAPAGLEAELLGGVWSLKPLNGNAIWLDDRFMSPRISPFLPRRGDYLLRKRYRTRMDMPEEVSLHFLVRENAEHHCAASIPRLHPPISVRLLPLLCIPSPPFLLFLGPTPLECRCGLKSPD
ncbi:hypothetical protein V8E52_006241 [Russula decolorans]